MRKSLYSVQMPFDLDSALLFTYGSKYGEGFNFHYQAHGYHPLLYYDSLAVDLLNPVNP